MPYYTLPLQLSTIMKKEVHPTCDIHTSIAQYIQLMVSTRYCENKYDEKFGNLIWENEFENIIKNNSLKERIKNALLQTIALYEHRLENVKAEIQLVQEETRITRGRQLREKVRIDISGTIKLNKEPFKHTESFYIAPLSYY